MSCYSPEIPSSVQFPLGRLENMKETIVSGSHSVVSTLCDPMDYSQPGSSVHGILQASIVEWGAISYRNYFILVLTIKATVRTWASH